MFVRMDQKLFKIKTSSIFNNNNISNVNNINIFNNYKSLGTVVARISCTATEIAKNRTEISCLELHKLLV